MSSKPINERPEGVIKDAAAAHWVYRAPARMRPYLQLSRLDRPVGYWLLALPGWIGLAFAGLSRGFAQSDLKWAALILIGAIAMRGAGCTYNDIVDQDLDKQVERTALRPLPAGTVSTKQAWLWLLAQCAAGLIVLLYLPRLAQIISLCSLPLVAAYPFMKRITWWPQLWLGLTFNWAVLVAYAIKVRALNLPIFLLYAGLVCWTVGYDTIYACQDIEDDAMIGVKSTARRFGNKIQLAVTICYLLFICFVFAALWEHGGRYLFTFIIPEQSEWHNVFWPVPIVLFMAFSAFALSIALRVEPDNPEMSLKLFKQNWIVAILLCALFYTLTCINFSTLQPGYVPPSSPMNIDSEF